MRRGLRLLLMALVCAALGGVYVLLGSTVAPAEAPAPESTDAPGYFMLYEDSVAALESITVQPKGSQRYIAVSDMAFDQNGNLLGVYNALSQPFLVSGQEDFTFSTAAWQMLLLTAQHIPATATYPALDRDACGLTDPDAVITLTRKDGTTRVLRIGRLTSDGASCYVALDGDTNVYLVPYDFHETMVQPLNALHTLPSAIDESASAAVQIALTGTDDGQLIFTKSSGKLMAWSATSPIAHAGSTERIEAFITGLCGRVRHHRGGRRWSGSVWAGCAAPPDCRVPRWHDSRHPLRQRRGRRHGVCPYGQNRRHLPHPPHTANFRGERRAEHAA